MILVCTSRPALAFTALDGSVLTDTAALTNGRPASVTRFQWPSGAQTTATTMRIVAEWDDPVVPRAVALLGTDLPAGTKVQVKVRYAGDSTFSAISAPNEQRIVQSPRGARYAIIVLPDGLLPCDAVQFILFNDVNGTASIAADTVFEIGEAWASKGRDIEAESNWGVKREDSTSVKWSPDQQPWVRKGTSRNVLSLTPAPSTQLETFGDPGDDAALDLDALLSELYCGAPVLCIARRTDDAGDYSPRLVHRTAIFGIVTALPAFNHAAGTWYEYQPITVTEAPIPT